MPERFKAAKPGKATLGIRPEHVGVSVGAKGDVELPVRLVEPLGKDTLLYFDAGTERAFVAVTEGLGMADIKVGERVALSFDQRRIYLFDAEGTADWRRPIIIECKPNVEEPMEYREKSEIRDGMRIDWDMPIKMEDGLVLRCDIYRPIADGKYPVIMTYGPYGKWLHFEDLYTDQWRRMCADQPDVPTGSTNKYQCWEVVDPEKWVPDGYVCIRVDSRGAGRSPGVIDIWSLREAQDLAQCVDWAGVQPWSNGKVGLNGISYYGREPMADGRAAAQASRRDLHLGGRRRFLPRHGAPRRHLLPRLRAGLVEGAGLHRAERARHGAASRAA